MTLRSPSSPSSLVLLLWVALCGALGACAHDPPAAAEPTSPPDTNPKFTEPLADAQTRVNRYFQQVASTTGFKDCWSRVQGEGLLRMAFNYKKAEASWTFESATTEVSGLPKGQDAVAL